MKPKQLKTKLVLQKATVTDLSTKDKGQVKGGAVTWGTCYFTCDPCGDTFPDRTCFTCPRVRTLPTPCDW